MGHIEGITFIDSRGDGLHFISNGKDQNLKLWDIRKMSSNLNQYVCFSIWPKSFLYWNYFAYLCIYFFPCTLICLFTRVEKNLSLLFCCRRYYHKNSMWDYRWLDFPDGLRHVKLPNDMSLATYRGHSVLHTLIRCYFSPKFR